MFGQHTYDSSMHAWLNQSLESERQHDYVSKDRHSRVSTIKFHSVYYGIIILLNH